MRLLVFGGRKFASLFPSRAEGSWLPPEVLVIREQQKRFMFAILDAVHAKTPITLLIHGGATGADSVAGEWAKSRGIPVLIYRALWHIYGKKAGPKRNTQMLKEGMPDRAIGFPGDDGTADMTAQAARDPHCDCWSITYPEGRWAHHQ